LRTHPNDRVVGVLACCVVALGIAGLILGTQTGVDSVKDLDAPQSVTPGNKMLENDLERWNLQSPEIVEPVGMSVRNYTCLSDDELAWREEYATVLQRGGHSTKLIECASKVTRQSAKATSTLMANGVSQQPRYLLY
jgi:hypothetical protein